MEKLKGIILVALGAASYGVLATFVKIAGSEGYHTSMITFSQFLIGFIVLLILNFFRKDKNPETAALRDNSWKKLLFSGISLGLTSTFYYLSVQYLPVSVCIILLMQAIWMGSFLDCALEKRWPGKYQLLALVVIIAGTLLATGVFQARIQLDWRGIGFGLLAALSYTATIYASNRVATHVNSISRSLLLVLGGLITLLIFWNTQIIAHFQLEGLWRWGIFLALFGTILPPLLFNKGFPKAGMSIGSIVSSIEIPVSIACAYLFLHEVVSPLQWLGVAVIIAAVVLNVLKDR
jgi:drug/metabolite transporter (DMT)-like permease